MREGLRTRSSLLGDSFVDISSETSYNMPHKLLCHRARPPAGSRHLRPPCLFLRRLVTSSLSSHASQSLLEIHCGPTLKRVTRCEFDPYNTDERESLKRDGTRTLLSVVMSSSCLRLENGVFY